MKRVLSLFIYVFIILVIVGSFGVREVHAASLGNIKDIITTSRPSASSPLNANAAASSGVLTIFDNGSRYLASDSASIIRTAGGVITNTGINISSQSADLTKVYLGSVTGTFAGAGSDTLIVPITAVHTISFSTITNIPTGGHIIITFPGSGSNAASPSATTFVFNNFNSFTGAAWDGSAAPIRTNGVTCSSSSVIAAPSFDCVVSGSAVAPGTTVTIMLGCTNSTGATCTAGSPRLVNPTKSAAAGTADTWKVSITTNDGSNDLDTGSAKVATIESVQVQATVEPTLTFTISGATNGANLFFLTNYSTAGCGTLITTNSGIDSTATSVNLGILTNAQVNTAAQKLTVSTNGSQGYVITATSSGQLRNPASGQIIVDANGGTGLTANDTPAPGLIAAGTAAFGVHACGPRSSVNTDQWVNIPTSTGLASIKFSNPWNTGVNSFYNTIASYTGGPVTNEATAVLYGATVSGTTPAGVYTTNFTYVASATF